MPYSGIPKDKTATMEKCVKDVMGQGHDKSSAIAICHNSIMGGVSVAEATLQYVKAKAGLALKPVGQADMAYVHALLGAQAEDAELLKFEGAVLAREGRNANGDGLRAEGLQELAATLPLMAIDDEHHDRRVVGFITNPRREADKLLIDGLIYARRFPEMVAGILAGTKKLSVEAFAVNAECSVCAKSFVSDKVYCEHLQGRRVNGATRWLSSLKGIGAGITENPAEASATFDENRVTFLASLDESRMESMMEPQTESMMDKNMQDQHDQMSQDGQMETPPEGMMDENEKKELEATLADVRAQLAAKVTELEVSQAKVTELEAKLADSAARLEASDASHTRVLDLLEAGFTRAEVEGMREALASTSDTVLQVLKATKQEAAKNVVAAAVSEKPVKPVQPAQQVLGGDNDRFDLSAFEGIFA